MKIITQGVSRIVFVYKDTAIKIPWINLFGLFRSFLKYKKEGPANGKANRFHKNIILAGLKVPFYILSANRREYLYFKKHSEEKSLLPIRKSFLFGYIIVQPRGEILKEENIRWKKLLSKLVDLGVKDTDLLSYRNFCFSEGKIKLLDYGSSFTQIDLDTIGFEIIHE